MSTLAWGRLESPLGPLLVGVSTLGLARVLLPSDHSDRAELREDDEAAAAVRQLAEYFAGDRREFTLPLDWSGSAGFRLRVLEEMSRLPYGETVTYSELAARAGNPRAPRAAGHTCATNPIPIVLPCHRVVGRDGRLHGYTGGLHLKEFLLRLEGVDPAGVPS